MKNKFSHGDKTKTMPEFMDDYREWNESKLRVVIFKKIPRVEGRRQKKFCWE